MFFTIHGPLSQPNHQPSNYIHGSSLRFFTLLPCPNHTNQLMSYQNMLNDYYHTHTRWWAMMPLFWHMPYTSSTTTINQQHIIPQPTLYIVDIGSWPTQHHTVRNKQATTDWWHLIIHKNKCQSATGTPTSCITHSQYMSNPLWQQHIPNHHLHDLPQLHDLHHQTQSLHTPTTWSTHAWN